MLRSYALSITVKGPVLTRATAAGHYGVDAPIARLSTDNRPYLPGTHVLGKARHALDHLLKVQAAGPGGRTPLRSDALQWFGFVKTGADGKDIYGDETEGLGHRRQIFCSDLVASTAAPLALRTRITIDDDIGATEDGMLQTLETPYASGEMVPFAGVLRMMGSDVDIAAMETALRLALNWTTQFGGLRTVGFGRSAAVAIKALPPPSAVTLSVSNLSYIPLCLRFCDPLTIGERRNASNIYNTSDVVPGGAIKGALAALILAGKGSGGHKLADTTGTSKLAQHFSHIRITHLFPAAMDARQRPTVRPLSLVATAADPSEIKDVALIADSGTIGGAAPAFAIDWKPKHKAAANGLPDLAWSDVQRNMVVRTSIEMTELSAETSMLYAQQHCEIDRHVWIGSIDLRAVPPEDRETVAEELSAALAGGLPGVGRSQSYAMVEPSAPAPSNLWQLQADCNIVLTLQTPALLRVPDGGDYKSAIHALSGGALAYVCHFATERLSGAAFMNHRYFKGKTYKPWLLTEFGSVFVVRATGDTNAATACIRCWLDHGLPIPTATRAFYGLDTTNDEAELWQACPYIRHNGYGEVAGDLPVHRDRKAVLDV